MNQTIFVFNDNVCKTQYFLDLSKFCRGFDLKTFYVGYLSTFRMSWLEFPVKNEIESSFDGCRFMNSLLFDDSINKYNMTKHAEVVCEIIKKGGYDVLFIDNVYRNSSFFMRGVMNLKIDKVISIDEIMPVYSDISYNEAYTKWIKIGTNDAMLKSYFRDKKINYILNE